MNNVKLSKLKLGIIISSLITLKKKVSILCISTEKINNLPIHFKFDSSKNNDRSFRFLWIRYIYNYIGLISHFYSDILRILDLSVIRMRSNCPDKFYFNQGENVIRTTGSVALFCVRQQL